MVNVGGNFTAALIAMQISFDAVWVSQTESHICELFEEYYVTVANVSEYFSSPQIITIQKPGVYNVTVMCYDFYHSVGPVEVTVRGDGKF